MSKREQKAKEKKRKQHDPGPITRRQQVAAIRQIKGQEIADAVATKIREAVKQEVETQLKAIQDTMFNLIDRVVDCEAKQNAVLMKRVRNETDEAVDFLASAVSDLEEEVYINEGDRNNRPERTETVPVQQDVEVVQGPVIAGEDDPGEDEEEGPTSR